MDPINYLGMVPQVDLGKQFLTGLQAGATIGEIGQQTDARQLAIQQKQLAMQRASQYQSDVSAALAAPREQQAQLFSALALRNPDQYEAITKGFGALSADQQKNELRDTFTIASTLHADRPDLAKQQIAERITAMKNSGQPTQDLEALRDLIDKDPKAAYGQVLHIASALPGGDKILSNLTTLNEDARKGAESDSKLAGNAADLTLKNLGIVGQTLGAMQGKGIKPEQAKAAIASLVTRGAIPKEERADWLAAVPSDPKELDAWLGTVRAGGMKPDDQTKYTTPTADARLSANTQIETTRMNNKNQLDVQDAIAKRQAATQQFKVEHGIKGLTDAQNDALFGPNGAVTTGRLDPNKINSKTASIFADAELKNPGTDFAKTSSDINSGRKADADFTTGKSGNAIRSFNVGIAHLDTLGNLADALNNGDLKAFNRIGNAIATQTGKPAPTNFGAAKKIVGDELVKAIVGAGGTGHDREEVAKTIDAANSPAQLKGAINTVQELMVGQLGGLEQQYRTTTKRDDFDKYLSPRALEIRKSHGGGGHGSAPAAAAEHPADISALLGKYGRK
jgi:hypothetical protein